MRNFLVFLFLSLALHAQTPAEHGQVLKALPLDFEETQASQPESELAYTTPHQSTQLHQTTELETATAQPNHQSQLSEPTPATLVQPALLDQKPTGDDAVRLQIFLDEANFGPGVIDGKIGRFTELAAQSWNEANGHPTESWAAVNRAARQAVPNPFAIAIVPEVISKWVNPNLPYKRAEQAKAKQMSYRSNGEFMSERYHTDVPYLISLNSAAKIRNLKPRDTIIVPNVSAFEIEKLTGAAYKSDDSLSERNAVIDTKLNQVRIYEANPRALIVTDPNNPPSVANKSLIAAFPITPGKPQFIKYGKWKMQNAVELPVWRYDQQLLETGKRSSDSQALHIPGGPNNPVGVLWCGLNKPGIGMHGTSDPETIGRSRSAGCIRLTNWDIVRIPGLLRPGASVEIR